MKKLRLLSLALIFGIPAAAFSQDYDGAAGRVFLSRTPVATQSALDSDIRLRSMGGVGLAVEDESNTLGVYKYLGFAAGAPKITTGEKLSWAFC